MSSSYPVIRLVAALTLMTIGGSAMYSASMVLEPAAYNDVLGTGIDAEAAVAAFAATQKSS